MRLVLAMSCAAALCACAGSGGRVETLSRAPSRAYARLAVAGVSAPGALGGEDLPRALAAALSDRFEAAAAADADSVVSSAELGLSGASPGMLAELRRATGAEAVVFGALTRRADALELTVLDARTGDLVLRVRVRPQGEAFGSAREAAAAGAAALAPLASGRRGKAVTPEPDELPPP
ncbi:MAG: hypothetical protein SF051_07920 [Elusimicrobiota bacterium]|nr:hypothetical protein [Elusimicrobiota bacterium]